MSHACTLNTACMSCTVYCTKSSLHTVTNRKAKTECPAVKQLCLVKCVNKAAGYFAGSDLDCYGRLGVLQTRRNGKDHFAH